MEQLPTDANQNAQGIILCCQCGTSIEPNEANMCIACVKMRAGNIAEGVPTQGQLPFCKFCSRYLMPPNSWVHAERDSKELLSLILKKLASSIHKLRLVDAAFVWTEPHSKRIKVKLTVQKEVFASVVLQDIVVIEFVVAPQMCEDCRRAEAKNFWRGCVQVRQDCNFKKTIFFMEQLVLKQNLHENAIKIKPVSTGIDFYYPKQQDAIKLVDFLTSVLPCTHGYSNQLVSGGDGCAKKADYRHTYYIQIAPICRDDVVVLSKRLAQSLGNMGQIAICTRISNTITIIDPTTLQKAEISGHDYFNRPFKALCQAKDLKEFYVLDVDYLGQVKRLPGHGRISQEHRLVYATVVQSHQVGVMSAKVACVRTHLGNILKPGDLVLGFDLENSNLNDSVMNDMKKDDMLDVVLVKKIFDKEIRLKRRRWKLKRMVADDKIAIVDACTENAFQAFMNDLEEDEQMRQKVNIYHDKRKRDTVQPGNDDADLPAGPLLEEMLEDLDLNTDVDMSQGTVDSSHGSVPMS